MEGWIKKHRRIMDHWLYEEERVFSRYEAFDYLLMMANHQYNTFLFDGQLLSVERGQIITSIRKLCARWKWSNTKVMQFLEALESDGMITKMSDSKKTVLTIDNYDKYQGYHEEETTEKRQINDTKTTLKHTNKNEKNLKNEKNEKTITTDYAAAPFKLFESEGFGTISSVIADKLGSMIDDYGERWVIEAMKIAVYKGKRNLGYVAGILRTFSSSGIDEPWTVEPKQKQEEKPRELTWREKESRYADYEIAMNEYYRNGGVEGGFVYNPPA